MADVDGVDPGGAALQQHVGEAAGRGADVERHHARGIDAEMVEAVGELEPASGDVGRACAAHLERQVGGDALPGLVQPPLAGEDLPGQDQRLRLGAALGQPALDEQLIEAELCACSWSVGGPCRRTLADQRRRRR